MTIHRFFIINFTKAETVVLPQEIGWQIGKVLRLQKGENIIISNNNGTDFTYALEEINKDIVVAKFISQVENTSEPKTNITLFQSLIPREKFEDVLQKCTEIGISQFVPIQTARSIVHAKDINDQKLDRWQKIIQEAAEQSERAKIPTIKQATSFEKAMEEASTNSEVFIAWEEEDNNFPSTALQSLTQKSVAIFIGPEGGFTQEEVTFAKKFGAKTISLGPRILRSETAGGVLATLILYSSKDLDTSSHR
ncbi:MAG TPA: RsmE family RNA methyltransferase [Patescibacteria group bacterium]